MIALLAATSLLTEWNPLAPSSHHPTTIESGPLSWWATSQLLPLALRVGWPLYLKYSSTIVDLWNLSPLSETGSRVVEPGSMSLVPPPSLADI